MKTDHLERIKTALIDLSGGMKDADTDRMLARMAELDALVAEAGRTIDPRLAHFLERRSYAKALAFLGVPTPSAG